MVDHVHMLISIPPKYAVANVVGFIKGKSAIHVARTFMEWKRNFVGQHFWARGHFVSTGVRVRRRARNERAAPRALGALDEAAALFAKRASC